MEKLLKNLDTVLNQWGYGLTPPQALPLSALATENKITPMNAKIMADDLWTKPDKIDEYKYATVVSCVRPDLIVYSDSLPVYY